MVASGVDEVRLRSPDEHVSLIRSPTYYIEGSESFAYDAFVRMVKQARAADVPFEVIPIPEATHFDILAPTTEYIAQQIAATPAGATLAFDRGEVLRRYVAALDRYPGVELELPYDLGRVSLPRPPDQPPGSLSPAEGGQLFASVKHGAAVLSVFVLEYPQGLSRTKRRRRIDDFLASFEDGLTNVKVLSRKPFRGWEALRYSADVDGLEIRVLAVSTGRGAVFMAEGGDPHGAWPKRFLESYEPPAR